MSFKAKMAAAAATFALAGGGLGMLGTLSASAATHRCGSNCQDLYTQKFGHRYLLATFQGKAAANQEVILCKASNRDPAEDFVMKNLGSVGSFYGQHRRLITSQFDTRYSSISAYEFQYEPNGVNSNLCLGTSPGQVAQAGFKVGLEPCGEHRNSVWAIFTGQFAGDVHDVRVRRPGQCRDGQLLRPARAQLPGRQPDRHAESRAGRPAAARLRQQNDLQQPAVGLPQRPGQVTA